MNGAFDRHVRCGEQQLEREATYIVSEMKRAAAKERRDGKLGKACMNKTQRPPQVGLLEHPLTQQSVAERQRNHRVEEITRNNMQKGACRNQPSFAELVHGERRGRSHSHPPASATSANRRIAVAALLDHGSSHYEAPNDGDDYVVEVDPTYVPPHGSCSTHVPATLSIDACIIIQRWWRRVALRLMLQATLAETRMVHASIYLDEAARVIVQFMRNVRACRRRHRVM